jgi:hypothetical protein
MTRQASLASLVAVVLVLATTVSAHGQSPTPQASPPGSVSGTVRNGTAGMTSVEGVEVQLLALTRDGRVSSQDAPVVDGRFEFRPPASATVTYILRVTYQGVAYLEPPILLSPEVPDDRREITVYEATTEASGLRIESTVVSVQGLDRAQGQLTLQREDQVINATDRVYVGGDDRVSLRLPAPEGVIDMLDAETLEGESMLDGGVAATTQPLKPGVNLIVTRYLVGYDRAADEYRIRVTAPLPTAHMEIWVPERFVRDIELGADATVADDRVLEGEQWRVVARDGAAAEGEGLTATAEGLSRSNAANPLTQWPGVAAAVVLSLAAVLVGVALLSRVRLHWSREAAA